MQGEPESEGGELWVHRQSPDLTVKFRLPLSLYLSHSHAHIHAQLLGSLPVRVTEGSKVVKDIIDRLRVSGSYISLPTVAMTTRLVLPVYVQLVHEVKGDQVQQLKEVDITISLRTITVFAAGTKVGDGGSFGVPY